MIAAIMLAHLGVYAVVGIHAALGLTTTKLTTQTVRRVPDCDQNGRQVSLSVWARSIVEHCRDPLARQDALTKERLICIRLTEPVAVGPRGPFNVADRAHDPLNDVEAALSNRIDDHLREPKP